jgi:hypothetical protein
MHCEHARTPCEQEIALTPEMIRAGVDAFQRWNPELEEPEALVV